MSNVPWTEADNQCLMKYVSSNKSLKYMSKQLNRSEDAIRLHMRRLGLQSTQKGRRWTSEDERLFARDWVDEEISNALLMRRYNRTWKALQMKAMKLHLGPRSYDTSYISVQEISSELCVTDDKVYHWIDIGLKTHKGINKKQKYLVDVDDLLSFLEHHQDAFDASKINMSMFYTKPSWLIAKRTADFQRYNNNAGLEWTNSQDKELVYFYTKHHWSLEKLAKHFGRTATAIRTRLYTLCIDIERKDVYSEEEINYLKANSDIKTISELASTLGRTQAGVMYKCKMLGIPYHTSMKRINH